jgi:hypothetical protein
MLDIPSSAVPGQLTLQHLGDPLSKFWAVERLSSLPLTADFWADFDIYETHQLHLCGTTATSGPIKFISRVWRDGSARWGETD